MIATGNHFNFKFAARSTTGGEQHATGMLYLDLQIPPLRNKKIRPPVRWSLFFGGEGGI